MEYSKSSSFKTLNSIQNNITTKDDKPKDECAIFGMYNNSEAANFTYLGLYSMQHRGQESSGIVSTDGEHLSRMPSSA